MDVRAARAPEATPSPGRMPLVGPPDTRGRGCQPKPDPAGLARPRPGWRTRVLPAPDIAIATPRQLSADRPSRAPRYSGTRTLASPSPRLSDAFDMGITTLALPQAAPAPGRTPPA